MHGKSWQQSLQQDFVVDKSRKSATHIMKVGDMICVADFHD